MWRMARVAAANGKAAALSAAASGPANIGNYQDFRASRAVVESELVSKQLIAANSNGHSLPDAVRTQTTFEHEFSLPTPGLFVRGGRDVADVADPSLFREVSSVGGVIADELEGLAVSFIERLGSGIVPAVMNKVVAAQALWSGANASLP